MQPQISGTVLPVLQIGLDPGESVVAETGELSWKTPNIAIVTTTTTAGSSGFFGALGRALAGGGLFMTEFIAERGRGMVAFAAKVPGTIQQETLRPGQALMVHKHGFLAGTRGITLSAGFQRSLGAGIFGGNGFILQRIAGEGIAWVELGGECIRVQLAEGEELDVHPGHVGMFEEGVGFDITMLPGIRNKLFGGDGLFFVRLRGPGQVWLQTLTLPNLAHALSPYIGAGAAEATQGSAAGVIAGSLVSRILK